MRRWIAAIKPELGPRIGIQYSVKQVVLIFRVYGYPFMGRKNHELDE